MQTIRLGILSILALGSLVCNGSDIEPFWLRAPESGHPLQKSYTPNEHPGGPLSNQITHDSHGNTFIANEVGVLKFNGSNWSVLPHDSGPKQSIGVAVDAENRVWVSFPHQLGYYQADSGGHYRFTDLGKQIDELLSEFDYGQFWELHADSGAVYINTSYALIRYQDGRFQAWTFETPHRIHSSIHDSTLYLHIRGDGLYRLVGDDMIRFAPEPPAINGPVIQILPGHEGSSLALTTSGKLFTTSRQELLAVDQQYYQYGDQPVTLLDALKLSPDFYALASSNNGVMLLDLKQRTIRRMCWEDDYVHSLALSPSGNLWASSSKQLIEVQNLPVSVHHSPQIHDLIRYKDSLITAGEQTQVLAPGSGLIEQSLSPLDRARFSQTMATAAGDLLISLPREILIYRDGQIQQTIPMPRQGSLFCVSQVHTERVYIADHNSVTQLQKFGTQWSVQETLDKPSLRYTSLAELNDGSLLATVDDDTVYHITWSKPNGDAASIQPVPKDYGLPDNPGWCRFLQKGRHIALLSQKGVYTYDSLNRTFSQSSLLKTELGAGSAAIQACVLDDQWGWFITIATELRPTVGKLFYEDFELHWQPMQLPSLESAGRVEALMHEFRSHHEVLWLGGNNGLFRYDLNATRPYPSAKAMITSVKETDQNVSYFGGAGTPKDGLELDYPQTSLQFEFSSPASSLNIHAYQTRLIGLNENWSPPNERTYRSFNNLREGHYRFEVRAIDEFGREGPKSSYSLRIIPPWYRSPIAYTVYIACIAIAVLYIIRAWTRHLRRRNEELEETVTHRTLELERRNLELTEANNIKQYFLASMSHEIRNPMNGILGIARLMKEDSKNDAGTERINHLYSCARHLHQLLGEVLDYSSLEAGKLQINKVCYNAADLISDVIDIHLEQASEKALELHAEIPEIQYQWIGDPVLLRQILINLVSNAIKYTKTGQVVIRLEVRERHAIFSVEDNGPGIPLSEQEQIFDKFTRLKNATEQEISGTGLGLSIAKEMSELMQGKLYVDSEYRSGARFVLDLELDESNLPIQSKAPSTGVYDTNPLRNLRVLVTDDMDFNRYINAQLVKRMGASTDEASSGREALSKLIANNYDLALLDINMPDMTGIEVVREYLEGSPVQPPQLVALSAYKTDIMEASCLAAGFDHFLEKPLEPEKLLRTRNLGPAKQSQIKRPPANRSLLDYLSQSDPSASTRMEQRYQSSMQKQLLELRSALEHRDNKAQRTIIHKLRGLISLKKLTK